MSDPRQYRNVLPGWCGRIARRAVALSQLRDFRGNTVGGPVEERADERSEYPRDDHEERNDFRHSLWLCLGCSCVESCHGVGDIKDAANPPSSATQLSDRGPPPLCPRSLARWRAYSITGGAAGSAWSRGRANAGTVGGADAGRGRSGMPQFERSPRRRPGNQAVSGPRSFNDLVGRPVLISAVPGCPG